MFPKRQNSVNPTIEYVFVDFNAWEYCATDELWAGLIRGLYQKVEKKFEAERESIKLQWRVQRAVDILKEEFGGTAALFARFVILTVLLAGLLVFTVLSYYFETLTIKISEFNDNQLATVASILTSAYYLWTTCNVIFQSAEVDRGQAIYSDAISVKDKIGFLAKVRNELSELFKFINNDFKDLTQKQLRLVLFIDDLDRCLGGRNVKMLEAIQLLLNVPGAPVFIFLAIDSRVVVASIEQHLNKSLKLEDAVITGWEYLEKIVQIPFSIPEISGERAVRYMTNIIRKNASASTVASHFWIIKAQYDRVLKKYTGEKGNLELWIDFPATYFELLEAPIGGVCVNADNFMNLMKGIVYSKEPLIGLEELSGLLRVAQNKNDLSVVQSFGKEGQEILCQQFEILFNKCRFFYCSASEIQEVSTSSPEQEGHVRPPKESRALKTPSEGEEVKSEPMKVSLGQRVQISEQKRIPDRDAVIVMGGSNYSNRIIIFL